MKVGILTHYNVSSHGALLQMYALKCELEALGHSVSILTYNRNLDFIDEETKKRFSASIKNLPYYLSSYMGKDGLGALVYQFKKQKTLKRFGSENFSYIPYTSSKDLDATVVGADEVFALENGVNIMMFGHGITSGKLIAYAPSFGQTDVSRIEKFGCRELIESGLNKFDSLSVRDKNSCDTVRNITGKDVPVVCDPALLHDFSVEKKKSNKKYIVVYSYQSNFKDEERIKKIREYAKKNRCELWSVGVYYKWCDKQINCNPLEMLDIFSAAQAVITDTFHGTISSVIAKTPMAVFVRENNNNKLDYLLQMLGMTQRKVTSADGLEGVLSAELNFDKIYENVRSEREKGLGYLKKALGLEESNK